MLRAAFDGFPYVAAGFFVALALRWLFDGEEHVVVHLESWRPIGTIPYGRSVLLWLVTANPEHSGVVIGKRGFCGSEDYDKFWDGQSYRPLAWCSHWMNLPEGPPKPWSRIRPAPQGDWASEKIVSNISEARRYTYSDHQNVDPSPLITPAPG